MKIKLKIISVAVCLVMVFPFIAACGSKKLTYAGGALENATVGVDYYQSIADAEGADSITYALKDGGALPSGLTLSPGGEISGVPRGVSDGVSITVEAAAEGFGSAEAVFTFKILTGTLVYTGDGQIKAAVGKPFSTSVATAEGAGGNVIYAVTGGELPAGLTMNAAGAISGTPAELGKSEFTVTASSAGCSSAAADFAVDVVEPWLEYAGRTLSNGRVGDYYTAYVNTASGVAAGAEELIEYGLKAGSELPEGLELLSDGTVQGMPETQVARKTFTVTAQFSGYTGAEADFVITIQPEADYVGNGSINIATVSLPSAYVGVRYVTVLAATVSGVNPRPRASFAIKAGSALPDNFELLPDGTLRTETGLKPLAAGTHGFTVTVTAANCEPVEKEFTLEIAPAVLSYTGGVLSTATVNEAYEATAATAVLPEGEEVSVVYTLDAVMISEQFVDGLPDGLSFSDGVISGTPVKSVKEVYIEVTAAASGYTSKVAGFSFRIQEEIKTVSDGVFEVEFTDLIGKTGGGWSGGAESEHLLSNEWECGASNGFYVPFTYDPISFEFVFNSSAAVANVSLSLRLASEMGTFTFTGGDLSVTVNGAPVTFSQFTLTSEGGEDNGALMGQFADIAFGSVSLREGENVIVVSLLDNTKIGGTRMYGPAVDCLKLANFGSSVLTWRPATYNTDWAV
jgi:hypothetical protein